MKDQDNGYLKNFAEDKASNGKSLENLVSLDQTQVHPISRERPARGKEKREDADINNSFQQNVLSPNRLRRLFLKVLYFAPDL